MGYAKDTDRERSNKVKILIVAGLGISLVLFRGDLIKSWLAEGFLVTAASPDQAVGAQLRSLGAGYRIIPLSRTGMNPLKDLRLLFSLRKLIRTEKADYLFCYTAKPVIYGSLAAWFNRRVRVFSIITGLGYVFTEKSWKGRLINRLVVALYRLALLRNDKVFFQNPDDSGIFVQKKIVRPEKVVPVNGSGVNLDFYRPAPLPEGPPRFLLIARLLKEKGIAEYMAAARLIKQKHPQVHLALIGWFFEENPTAISPGQVEAWRREGLVEIMGETDDVRPFIAGASVYVLPSYREGTPRTVLEAMAMGRPIITTDVPGCRETVREGLNGFLVPVQDEAALAAAMERFILKPELIPAMGEESRRIAVEKYDVHKINAVINEVMGLNAPMAGQAML